MSAASDGFVAVRAKHGANRGWLRLTQTGWRYFSPEESARAQPIGDPLRTFILTADEVKRYFGVAASFDGFEVELP